MPETRGFCRRSLFGGIASIDAGSARDEPRANTCSRRDPSRAASEASAITEGELVAALTTLFSTDVPEGVFQHCMAAHRAVLVLPDDHPLADLSEIDPELLRKENFIGYADREDIDAKALTAQVRGHRAREFETRRGGRGLSHVQRLVAEIDVTLLWSQEGDTGPRSALKRALQSLNI